jgi:hypothetical protein
VVREDLLDDLPADVRVGAQEHLEQVARTLAFGVPCGQNAEIVTWAPPTGTIDGEIDTRGVGVGVVGSGVVGSGVVGTGVVGGVVGGVVVGGVGVVGVGVGSRG